MPFAGLYTDSADALTGQGNGRRVTRKLQHSSEFDSGPTRIDECIRALSTTLEE